MHAVIRSPTQRHKEKKMNISKITLSLCGLFMLSACGGSGGVEVGRDARTARSGDTYYKGNSLIGINLDMDTHFSQTPSYYPHYVSYQQPYYHNLYNAPHYSAAPRGRYYQRMPYLPYYY